MQLKEYPDLVESNKLLRQLKIHDQLTLFPFSDCLQHPTELEWALEHYVKRSPSHVLEIGSLTGATLWCWLQLLSPGSIIVSIDINPVFNKEHLESWTPPGVTSHMITGDSKDPLVIKKVRKLLKDRIDWVFVDGDHTYEGCLADFNNYESFVPSGGSILFHDTQYPPEPGAGIVFSELSKLDDFISEECNFGIGMGLLTRK